MEVRSEESAPSESQPESESEPLTSENGVLYQYETQHFGFTPITLLNGMYNSVCDLYREALKAFCRTCSEKYPDAVTEKELRSARHAVGQKIDKDVSRIFDVLEHFLLKNIFTIPDDVVLPEDRCQTEERAADNGMEEKKRELKQKIVAVKIANAQLSKHIEDSQALQTALDELSEKMSSEGKLSGMSAGDMKDYLSYYSDLLSRAVSDRKGT
ncbi:protein MIS12 homolog [Aplysia californica]|uniref:Protein MIS12 homolog n=1 Tax=Aplysia californica TaxID=6500 RepID=A0ABM0K6T6_APLCA|nr:protein MIS12 homolog [Aplysia californica]